MLFRSDPPPNATLNDVVSLLDKNGAEEGTGTVIGATTPDAQGNVTLAVMTADHVMTGGAVTAAFGQGPNATVPAGTYSLSLPLISGRFQWFSCSAFGCVA